WPRVRWVQWLSRRGSHVFRLRNIAGNSEARFDARAAVIPAVCVLSAAILQAAGVEAPVLGRGWVELRPTHWPVELLPELRAYERDHPEGTPVFNEDRYGGFLIYFTPRLRVFIDDRCELYGDEGLLAFTDAAEHDPARIEHWSRKYGFDLALTIPGS